MVQNEESIACKCFKLGNGGGIFSNPVCFIKVAHVVNLKLAFKDYFFIIL